jgi:hypothetical protein
MKLLFVLLVLLVAGCEGDVSDVDELTVISEGFMRFADGTEEVLEIGYDGRVEISESVAECDCGLCSLLTEVRDQQAAEASDDTLGSLHEETVEQATP